MIQSAWQRLSIFADIIYEPKQHLLFATLWYLSVSGGFVLLNPSATTGSPHTWTWSAITLSGALTFFIMLFVLRAIDEVKDLDYDRQYNPDRPLVSGAVSGKDIIAYVGLGTLLVVLMNAAVSLWLSLFLLFNVGYGLLLMKLEQWIPLMKRSLFFNLLLTYPVSIALSFYALLQTTLTQQVSVNADHFWLILCYIMAFLHFEIIRKSMWHELVEPGENLYSEEIGTIPALVVGSFCGIVACTGMVLLFQPWSATGAAAVTGWLPLLNLIWVMLSLQKFLRQRQTRFNPRGFSVPFIVCFYLFNLIHTLCSNALQFGH